MDAHGQGSPRRRLERHRERYEQGGPVFRAAWTVAGFAVLLAGLAMVVLPGPAVVALPLGLAMLSFRFAWAARLLDLVLANGARLHRRGRRGKAVALFGAVCAFAAATAAALYLV